ncbi:MAG: PIN domain-containing protein [Thaumarchaeota archaeon]|nr:PIN domain-containing protein [Nitrososphaerota archaeon]
MSAEAVVDTSVLVDAIVAEARRHSRARKELAGLKRMVVPSVVLYEMVWVLKRLGVDAKRTRSAVEAIVNDSKVVVFPDDGRLAVRAIGRVVDEGTSLANFDDKVVLETALKTGLPLLTYDSELIREAERAKVPKSSGNGSDLTQDPSTLAG